MKKKHLESVLAGKSPFRFGSYISEGINIFKQNIGGFFLFALLFVIISMVAGVIPFVGSLVNSLVLSPALTIGVFIVAHKIVNGQPQEFGDFFSGFNYVPQLALAALVTSIIILLSLIPFFLTNVGLMNWYWELMSNYQEMMMDPEYMMEDFPPFAPWTLVLVLPAIYLTVAYSFTYQFIVFYDLSFWDAMEASRRLLTKHWFVFFLFIIVLGVLTSLGVVGFCIGIFFTLPIMYCALYAAFADLTRLHELDEGQEGDNILDNLVE